MSEENPIDKNFKVGDKIVRFGRVYEIFKITELEAIEDQEPDQVIHFRPVYDSQATRSLTCSIPVSSIDQTNMRRPMSEQEVDELLKEMAQKVAADKNFNTRQAKEVLKMNDPHKIALILRHLAMIRENPNVNFTYTKKRIFRTAMKRLQEEIALVKGWELDEAQKKIQKILQKQDREFEEK